MHQHHARPSLPVNPNPILTPPNLAVTELHDTAAEDLQALNLVVLTGETLLCTP